MLEDIIHFFRKIVNFSIFLICCICYPLAPSNAHSIPEEKPFYMGVYIYEYKIAQVAKEQGKDYSTFLSQHLDILRKHGVNAIYLGGTTQKRFEENLRLAQEYDIKLIPQLDFAYFRGHWTDADLTHYAKVAGEFIRKYNERPGILAWSVREEVAHKDVERLAQYYTGILKYAPKAKFNLVHNNLDAAKKQPLPNPAIVGTDRYAFWWEFSGGGYLASPSFALKWTREQAGKYYTETANRGAEFMLVVTQGGMLIPETANIYTKNPEKIQYPKTEAQKRKLRQKILKFAREGRMGWKRITTPKSDFYNAWKYYRVPKNCMKALAWISVLEGAKLFFCWSYTPPTEKILDTDITKSAMQQPAPKAVTWLTLAGRPGMTNPQLEEFSEAAKEIRPYERIITKMTKLPKSPIKTKEKYTYNNAFSFPGLEGKVVVVQNSNVGTWPHNSRYFFKDSDEIYIDDKGNLVGYVPYKNPLDVHISFRDADVAKRTRIFDIETGKELLKNNGEYKVAVLPGSGKLIFIGSSEEADKLHKMMSLSPL